MRTTATVRRDNAKMQVGFPYPNTATQKELLDRFLNHLLVGAIGSGLAACLLFLMVLA